MGGLSRKMPVTKWTFLVGTLAIAGLPPLSGFFSKDEILAAAYHQNSLLFVLATLVAVLTSFYMFRLWFVAFGGKARSEVAEHAHESPSVMIWPLRILATLSILGGVMGINGYLERHLGRPVWAEHEVATSSSFVDRLFAPFAEAPLAALAGLAAFAFGASFAYAIYGRAETDPLPEKLRALSRAMRRRFYFDEIYGFFISITHEALSRLAAAIDRAVIAGLGIRGLHGTTEIFGRALRLVQTGNLQTYAFIFAVGVVVVLFIVLIPK